MSRRSGTTIRRAHQYQTRVRAPRVVWSSRYLDIRERLQIADLLRLGFSVRRIAAELGRHPSTIKRELDRHRSAEGRYLPRTADHDARQQRARPRAGKLTANIALRRLVQRKLNRCWSPDEVCGWLRKTYPDDPSMRLCPETPPTRPRRLRHRRAQRPPPKRAWLRHSSSPLRHRNGGHNNPLR
jgi:IS30 family transposase